MDTNVLNELNTLFLEFIEVGRTEKGYRPNTCTCWAANLRAYSKWLIAQGQPATVASLSRPLLLQYKDSAIKRKLRPRTIKGLFSPLRQFCAWLLEKGLLTENPAASIKMPRLDLAVRKLICDKEVKSLFAACERLSNPRRAALARGILSVLCYAGLRRQELLDLEVCDIDMKEKTLHVRHGKGDKARKLPMNKFLFAAMQEWMEQRALMKCRHSRLWAYDRGRAVGEESLVTVLEETKFAAGLAGRDNIKPHSLRHWFATNASRVPGASLKDVSAMLGHSDLNTTQIYLHTDIDQLRKVMEQANRKDWEEPEEEEVKEEAPARTSRAPQAKPAPRQELRQSEARQERRQERQPEKPASTTRTASRRIALAAPVVKPSRFARQDLRRR